MSEGTKPIFVKNNPETKLLEDLVSCFQDFFVKFQKNYSDEEKTKIEKEILKFSLMNIVSSETNLDFME